MKTIKRIIKGTSPQVATASLTRVEICWVILLAPYYCAGAYALFLSLISQF